MSAGTCASTSIASPGGTCAVSTEGVGSFDPPSKSVKSDGSSSKIGRRAGRGVQRSAGHQAGEPASRPYGAASWSVSAENSAATSCERVCRLASHPLRGLWPPVGLPTEVAALQGERRCLARAEGVVSTAMAFFLSPHLVFRDHWPDDFFLCLGLPGWAVDSG